MTVQAIDNPGPNAVARSDTARVIINVLRNPNAPRFTVNTYNVTISEYLPVQGSVVKTNAVDSDPANVCNIQFTFCLKEKIITELKLSLSNFSYILNNSYSGNLWIYM
jgi:hypothetical protein